LIAESPRGEARWQPACRGARWVQGLDARQTPGSAIWGRLL